jgi:hypothetical protein
MVRRPDSPVFVKSSLTLQMLCVFYISTVGKSKGKDKFHPRTCYESPEGESKYSSTVSLTSSLDGDGWSMPRPHRFASGKRPGIHRIGGWVDSRFGLDRYGKSGHHRDSISGPSSS